MLIKPTQSCKIILANKMKYSFAHIASLVALGECLSLPPLIPSIPGVTEPLTTNAPPLPILQVPTPPLESPPFTSSDIKPKKIGYFWTGSADKFHKGMYLLMVICRDNTNYHG
jgi:selenium-binding protein 1